ncbi:MAG: NYN domain-containing protein [Actinomycetota bacterium]|nr:NYN domain-containing protein [Actinomycetota bacterium]MDQ3752084.1 NYN domain-containing protein [Actinomycetota bacterium]
MTERPPPEAELILARSVAAFLRSAPRQQLPARLRRFQGIRPKGLGQHRAELLEVLEDEVLRRQINEWLDGRHPLARPEADLLRLAIERPEGWPETMRSLVTSSGSRDEGPRIAGLETALGRERERTRRAKDDVIRAKEEVRRTKEEARRTVSEGRSRTVELSKQVARLEGELTAAKRASKEAAAATSRAQRDRERAERKERASATKARVELDASVREGRRARRDATAALARAQRLEANLQAARDAQKAKKKATRAVPPKMPARRTPLPVPKGRLDDDPETMRAWLGAPEVVLLVDGYNVTKAQGGFGDLSLELQRERLVEGVNALQLKTKAGATVVFDGSTVAPGIGRPRKRRVKVVYSKEGETADDHIVALIERLAPHPVVLATNDKELQGRAAALGATVATSHQLLALLRRPE